MDALRNNQRKDLHSLQDKVQVAFDHLYLYYYKKVSDEDTNDLSNSLLVLNNA